MALFDSTFGFLNFLFLIQIIVCQLFLTFGRCIVCLSIYGF